VGRKGKHDVYHHVDEVADGVACDRQYAKYARRAEKHRQENLRKAELDGAKLEKEFRDRMEAKVDSNEPDSERQYIFDNEFSWTWALQGEQPPPSAVAGRRDTVSEGGVSSFGTKGELISSATSVGSAEAGDVCRSYDGRQDTARRIITLDSHGWTTCA
jgi:hypothetical protein